MMGIERMRTTKVTEEGSSVPRTMNMGWGTYWNEQSNM